VSSNRILAAVDLGAESGRVIVGHLDGQSIALEVMHRFENRPQRLPDGLHWDLQRLFAEILVGLGRTVETAGALDGVAVDAWGVDYALLDRDSRVLGLPFHYRDERVTAEVVELADQRVPRPEMYSRTGTQMLSINTVFQLLSEADSPVAAQAYRIAFIPELLGLWLTGELVNEATVASTSGLLDARTGRWAVDLIGRLGLPGRPFEHSVVEPPLQLGRVLTAHSDYAGAAARTPVWVVAGHDTASAFVAAPLQSPRGAVLSSGTWSLLGLELREPILGPDAAALNVTNERGLDGTVRLLRNVMGLWLLQECRREWRAQGTVYDYETLHRMARAAPDDVAVFDPDHESFLRGGDLSARILATMTATRQRLPSSPGELVRSILVSLACKYRLVLEQLEYVSGRTIEVVHVVGGGSRNALLCQLTADLLGRPVEAGPEEATALGNIVVQARAVGELGSVEQMRELVTRSVDIVRYEPDRATTSDETYERFLSVTGLARPSTVPEPTRRAS
jgi:rhamnulokinase